MSVADEIVEVKLSRRELEVTKIVLGELCGWGASGKVYDKLCAQSKLGEMCAETVDIREYENIKKINKYVDEELEKLNFTPFELLLKKHGFVRSKEYGNIMYKLSTSDKGTITVFVNISFGLNTNILFKNGNDKYISKRIESEEDVKELVVLSKLL